MPDGFVLPSLLARLATALGWGLQFGFYRFSGFFHPSSQDVLSWVIWSGGFSVAGWFAVGIPLAIFRPRLNSRRRAVLAVLGAGVVGISFGALLFRSPYFFTLNWFSGMMFATASVAMVAYLFLTWPLDGPTE